MSIKIPTVFRILIPVLALLPGIVHAGDWYANVGVASDYVWRGVTQTDGEAAASGSIEYVNDDYTYIGVWVTNTNQSAGVARSSEMDIYAGISGKSEEAGYDVGYIAYQYPGNKDLSFEEFYAAISVGGFTVKFSDSIDMGNYTEANFKFKFATKRDIRMNLHVGRYNLDNTEDYSDFSLSIEVGELTFTASETDLATAADKRLKIYIVWEHPLKF